MVIGQIQVNLGHPVPAEQAFRQALDIFARLTVDFPDRPSYRHNLASTQFYFGDYLRSAPGRRHS